MMEILDYNDYAASAPDWKHYVIPVGQYYTGQKFYLFFGNDQDISSPIAESYFRNIQIFDVVPTPTATPMPTITSTPMSTLTPTSSYQYDRAIAVNYADSWAHYRNSEYPLSNEVGCACNDCTNYISQVLHEGGYPLHTGNWDENNLEEWWYRDNDLFQPNHSKTWTATDWFYIYAFFYAEKLDVQASFADLEPGDFILLDFLNNDNPDDPTPDGKPDHGRVVVGYGDISQNVIDYVTLVDGPLGCEAVVLPTPPATQTLLVNQHCTDRWHVAWDYNVDPEIDKFYIHVID